MKRAWTAATATLGACALGLATFTAAGAGDGAGPPASPLAARYAPLDTIAGPQLERASKREVAIHAGATRVAASADGSERQPARLKLKYYIGVDFQAVPPGGAQLFEIRCPARGEQPLTGGMFAPLPGLVAVNSSRTNPQPGFPTRPRAWYQAVVNITAAALEWKPFVTCASNTQ